MSTENTITTAAADVAAAADHLADLVRESGR